MPRRKVEKPAIAESVTVTAEPVSVISDVVEEQSEHTAPPVAPGERPFFIIRISRRVAVSAFILLVIVIAVGGAGYYFHWGGFGLSAQQRQEVQVTKIVGEVGALMILPSGETPVIATVTDASSLKLSQPFYANVENGDVLLVYSKAERAILYRPSDNKIVNVGPIYVTSKAGTNASASSSQR